MPFKKNKNKNKKKKKEKKTMLTTTKIIITKTTKIRVNERIFTDEIFCFLVSHALQWQLKTKCFAYIKALNVNTIIYKHSDNKTFKCKCNIFNHQLNKKNYF